MIEKVAATVIGIPILLLLAICFTHPLEFISQIENNRLLASLYFRFNRDGLNEIFDEMEKGAMTSYNWLNLTDQEKEVALTIIPREIETPIDAAHGAELEALRTHGDEDHELSGDLKSAVRYLGIRILDAFELDHGWEMAILDQLSCSPDRCSLRLLRV